jgi:hypothetical protein
MTPRERKGVGHVQKSGDSDLFSCRLCFYVDGEMDGDMKISNVGNVANLLPLQPSISRGYT